MSSLNHIKAKNILVIGDLMLDTYYSGDVQRISPEAPVPVFKKTGERSVLGGAANVAANLVAASQHVSMMSIVGKDKTGERLIDLFHQKGIDTSLILSIDRNTTEKIRFLASNNQQVLRLDIENTNEISSNDCERMLSSLEKQIDKINIILMSDYLKGLLSYEFTQGVLRMAKAKDIPVIIDVKDPKVDKYQSAYLLKPNLTEVSALTGMPVSNDDEIIAASKALKEKCGCRYVLTTCGARGMVLIGEEEPYFIKSAVQEIFDVTGAGDTTIAYLAACMANGLSMRESVDVANCAAGIQVSKVGTSSVYWSEVRERLTAQKEGIIHKLLSNGAVDDFRINHTTKKIVFTNGCFDILHIGHIRYLQKAAKLGDVLVVGLNSDASVKRLKGEERPINSELDRAEQLCALEFIDYVAIFEEDTPLELIKKIQPDVLVKGGDYSNEYVVGTNEIEARGGKLVLIPYVEGKSTTNIIDTIKKKVKYV